MRFHYDESNLELRFDGSLTIQSTEEAQPALVADLAKHTPETIDLTKIKACDTAGVQFLVALEKSLERAGKPFRITAVSDVVRETAASLGVHLDIPTATTAETDSNGESEEAARG